MFKEIVRIKDATGDKVRVSFSKKSACSHCHYSSLCGGAGEETLIKNEPFRELKEGDKIEIGIEEKKIALSSIIFFLFPVIIFLSFIILLRKQQEIISFSLAISAVVIYYIVVKAAIRGKGKYFNITILRKL